MLCAGYCLHYRYLVSTDCTGTGIWHWFIRVMNPNTIIATQINYIHYSAWTKQKKCFNIVQCSLIVTARYLPASLILWSNTNGCRELNDDAMKCKWTDQKKKRVSNSISPQFVECIDMITIKRIRLHIFWYEFHMHKLWWQIITIKSSTAFIIRREIKLIIISLLVVWFFFFATNWIL